eukprot:2585549-Ditylum_brightwellii.AAC.1
MESTKKLNFFPAKHGMSKYNSPQMILHQENIGRTEIQEVQEPVGEHHLPQLIDQQERVGQNGN